MSTVDLTGEDFQDTVLAEGIVLVDYWASWCGPCKSFAPVYEAASDIHTDIVFAKVDTEANQDIAAQANISAIPTLMVFRDGILLFNQAGAMPAPQLEQLIGAVRDVDMDEVRMQLNSKERP